MYYGVKMNDIKKLLGKRIKELRKTCNLSQLELAEKANIDQRSLSHIECGDTFPSRSLLDLAVALNVEVSELFDFNHINVDIKTMAKYVQANIEKLTPENIVTVYRLVKILK